jgi:hypothetical protein
MRSPNRRSAASIPSSWSSLLKPEMAEWPPLHAGRLRRRPVRPICRGSVPATPPRGSPGRRQIGSRGHCPPQPRGGWRSAVQGPAELVGVPPGTVSGEGIVLEQHAGGVAVELLAGMAPQPGSGRELDDADHQGLATSAVWRPAGAKSCNIDWPLSEAPAQPLLIPASHVRACSAG